LIGDGVIEPYQEQQQQPQAAEEEEERIYEPDDGLTSNYTKNTYRNTFNHFIKITVKNDNRRVLLDTKQSVVESKIINHIKYLNEVQHLGHLSIQTHLSGILRFFAMNDYHLNIKKIRRFLPEDIAEDGITDRPYSVTEIEKILSKCKGDDRCTAVVLIMASTGMRISGLRELRYGDIKKIDEYGLYIIWVYNRYRKDRYITFCTPECADAIDAYLDYRRRFGEEIKDKSPLIREQFNIDNPFLANAPKFLSRRSISHLFEDVLKRAGINQVRPGHKKRDIMTSHGLRKHFFYQCERANLNYTTLQLLSGHKLRRVDASYKRTTEEDMLSEYVRAIPFLTIDPNQRLEQENQDLKVTQAQELERLKAQLSEKEHQLRQTVEALEIKSKNSIDNIEKQILKLNDMIVEITTDNEHGGMHYYKFKKA
jgi:integrase